MAAAPIRQTTGTTFDVAGNCYVVNYPLSSQDIGTVSKFDKTIAHLVNAAFPDSSE